MMQEQNLSMLKAFKGYLQQAMHDFLVEGSVTNLKGPCFWDWTELGSLHKKPGNLRKFFTMHS